jgi:4'-phosphopantetheinyl transferase
MPLLKLEQMGEGSQWAVWFIDESEEELAFDALESPPEEIISPQKRLEYLAGRALIKMLVEHNQLEYDGLRKDEFGKPFLKDHPHQVSLSHSFPYVAAQLHSTSSVGIDIEQPKEKLLRIASRVLSEAEINDAGENVVKHCVYWCAKEALYKIYGKRGLHFNSQLNVDSFELRHQGELSGKISASGFYSQHNLGYWVHSDFVLAYTIPG